MRSLRHQNQFLEINANVFLLAVLKLLWCHSLPDEDSSVLPSRMHQHREHTGLLFCLSIQLPYKSQTKEDLKVLQASASWWIWLYLHSFLVVVMVFDGVPSLCSSSGCDQLGGRDGHSSGAPLQLCCPGGCSPNLPHPLWGGGSMVLCGPGYQGLSHPALGGPTDATVRWLACGEFIRLKLH